MTQALRDLQHALEKVYGGLQDLEAGCVMDQLTDLGWTLTPLPVERVQQDELPLASTRGLGKRAAS